MRPTGIRKEVPGNADFHALGVRAKDARDRRGKPSKRGTYDVDREERVALGQVVEVHEVGNVHAELHVFTQVLLVSHGLTKSRKRMVVGR